HPLRRTVVIAPSTAFSHPEKRTTHAATVSGCASIQPDIETDNQQCRAEAEKHRQPWVGLLNRHCADLHIVLDQKGLKAGVDKVGKQCSEIRTGYRRGTADRGDGDRPQELAFDLPTLAVYRPNIAVGDLL